jgi:tetratricopeptide (TPR) repeat protein
METLNLTDALVLAEECYKVSDFEQALKLYSAVEQASQTYMAMIGAANSLTELERPEEALPRYDRAYLILRDEMLALTSNRAKALAEAGRAEEALALYEGLMSSQPVDKFRLDRALTLMQMGRHEETIIECTDVLSREPDNDIAKFARGFAYLVLGDYENGFRDYEFRKKDDLDEPDVALWTGKQDLSGKTILVHAEMGLGDNIMFMRYVPLMVERGAKVICVLPESQKFLVNALDGVEWRSADRSTWPKLDYWVRFMSLAWCFKTNRDTIPPPVKLKRSVCEKLVWMRDSKYVRQNDLKVGLCWAGNTKSRYDKHRTVPLEKLSPLWAIPGVTFFSLQKDVRESDKAAMESSPIIDLSQYLDTFEDTAAAMRNLDLMITVDTSVAHLAGTVGVPTLVMLTSFRTYWLWINKLSTSPWYPSIEVIRQKIDGDWSNVIDHAVDKTLRLQPSLNKYALST